MTSEKAIRLGIKTIPISLRNAALKHHVAAVPSVRQTTDSYFAA